MAAALQGLTCTAVSRLTCDQVPRSRIISQLREHKYHLNCSQSGGQNKEVVPEDKDLKHEPGGTEGGRGGLTFRTVLPALGHTAPEQVQPLKEVYE